MPWSISLQKWAWKRNSVRAACILRSRPHQRVYPTLWQTFIHWHVGLCSPWLWAEATTTLIHGVWWQQSCVTSSWVITRTQLLSDSLKILGSLGSQPPYHEEAPATWREQLGRGGPDNSPSWASAERQHQRSRKNKPSGDSSSYPVRLPAEAPVLVEQRKTVLPLWPTLLTLWNWER